MEDDIGDILELIWAKKAFKEGKKTKQHKGSENLFFRTEKTRLPKNGIQSVVSCD
jgi:hypothetical protein